MSGAAQHESWVRAMPVVFVLIWSTGFIVARFAMPYSPPMTFLWVRYLLSILAFWLWIRWARVAWPQSRAQWWHLGVTGVFMHAGYLGGVWSAIKLGMPAGLSALIVGLQPILTAFAAPLVGERVSARQWLGLLLGLGGVALVVYAKISLNGLAPAAIGFCVLVLLSITCGTLYQKRFCPQFDLRTGTLIQFTASALLLLPPAVALEGFGPTLGNVHWTPQFLGALLWSIFALSIGAIFLLFRLISRNDATKVTSLLYLTPPTTAVMAWLMFGEALSPLGLVGMAVAVMGVAFVVKK